MSNPAVCSRRPRGALTRRLLALLAVGSLGLLALPGCDQGDASDPAGGSTVQGNVVFFSAGGVTFRPTMSAPGAKGFLYALAEAMVPSAQAAVEGVTVRMVGTGLETTTASDGTFVMSGVPAGIHPMQFSYAGSTSMMEVDVPADATVTMTDIRCAGPQATVGHMDVQMHDQMDADDMMGSPGRMHDARN